MANAPHKSTNDAAAAEQLLHEFRDFRQEVNRELTRQGEKVDEVHLAVKGNADMGIVGFAKRLEIIERWKEEQMKWRAWLAGAYFVVTILAIAAFEWLKSKFFK